VLHLCVLLNHYTLCIRTDTQKALMDACRFGIRETVALLVNRKNVNKASADKSMCARVCVCVRI